MSLWSYTNYKNNDPYTFVMAEITHEDLASRLDLLQHNIWNIEDRAIRVCAMLSKNQADMEEVIDSQKLLSEKLDRLDAEIRALRDRNGNE